MDIHTCLNCLRDGDAEEKLAAIEQLRAISFTGIAECLIDCIEQVDSTADKEKRLQVLKNFAFPRINVTLVQKMYGSQDPFVRNAAVELLRKNDEAFLAAMTTLAEDPDKDVRKFVVDTLAGHASGEGLRIVKERLADDNINVRQSAIEALGNMGETAAALAIETALERETNLMLRCTCLEALARLGYSPSSRAIIEQYAHEPNPILFPSLLRYLGVLGAPEDLDMLETFLDGGHPLRLGPVVAALTGIVERHRGMVFTKSLVHKLRTALAAHHDSDLAWELARVLLLGLGSEGLEEAMSMLNDASSVIQIAAREYLDQAGISQEIPIGCGCDNPV